MANTEPPQSISFTVNSIVQLVRVAKFVKSYTPYTKKPNKNAQIISFLSLIMKK